MKNNSDATFKFDQLAKNEMAKIVEQGGGGGGSTPEVKSAIETGGIGWTDTSKPIEEVAIEWDGNIEGKQRGIALEQLIIQADGGAPDPDVFQFWIVKISDEIYPDLENYPCIFGGIGTSAQGVHGITLSNNTLSLFDSYTLDNYSKAYCSNDTSASQFFPYSIIVCEETHNVEVDGETFSLESGVYFTRAEVYDHTGDEKQQL